MLRDEVTTTGTSTAGRALDPERAPERRREYMTVLDEDPTDRADALGLRHVGDCSDDNPVDDRLRCWRCYYIHAGRKR